MKALVFEGPGRIEVRRVADPPCPPDGILVRVGACGICGSDVRAYRSGLRTGGSSQIMGHEIAGVVEQAGAACRRLRAGDRVAVAPDVSCGACHYCRSGHANLCIDHRMIGTHWPGGFAQFIALSGQIIEHGIVHRIPDGLSLHDAALSEPLSSVLAAQEMAGIGPGLAVAVFGDGPMGCLHVETARRSRGASPVILVGRRRLGLASAFCPDLAVDARSADPVAVIRERTEGLGADVAIIAAPAAEWQELGVESVRKRGRVILFGGLPRENPFARLDANRIHYNELSVMGSFSYPGEMHCSALEAIHAGRVSPSRLVSRVVPLEGIEEAILDSEQGKVLKVLVDPWK